MKSVLFIFAAAALAVLLSGRSNAMREEQSLTVHVYDVEAQAVVETNRVVLSDKEWRQRLPQEAYRILRAQGTERPFTCGMLKDKGDGVYHCLGCGLPLFDSTHKFDSGTGWPSFYRPIHDANIGTSTDYHLGYARTEVHCIRCDGHLGHVFEDGPKPTGLRYCINGAALGFTSAP